jgi:hypothetical protein
VFFHAGDYFAASRLHRAVNTLEASVDGLFLLLLCAFSLLIAALVAGCAALERRK